MVGVKGVDGKKYVKSRDVSIKVSSGDARYVRLSNDGNFENSRDIDISVNSIIPWELSEGEGEKIVYARFYDEIGNYTDSPISDTVYLYSRVPTSPYISINNGSDYSNTNEVNISLRARDAISYAMREDTQFEESDWKEFVPDTNNEMIIPYTLSNGDGVKILYAKFKDIVGNESVIVFDSITIDTLPPTLTQLLVNNGNKYTRSTNVNISISAVDAFEMKISCDGINYTDWMAFTGLYTCALSSENGSKIIKAVVRDAAGNESQEAESEIIYDDTPPTNTNVIIKGTKKDLSGNDVEDTALTYKSNVTLELEAEGATKVAISTQPLDCATATYESVEFVNNVFTINDYQLDGGTGIRKVNVCFADEAGNYTTIPKTANIYLDTQSPFGLFFSVNNGEQFTNSLNAKIDLIKINDDHSERYVMFSNCEDFSSNNCDTTQWLSLPLVLPFDWRLLSGDGVKSVYMKARDGAGNESYVYSVSLTLDTIAPSNVMISPGAMITKERNLNIHLNAEGADFICIRGDILDPCNPSEPIKWKSFTTSMQVELLDYLINEPGPDGEVKRKITVDFKDKAGNITTSTVTITYDRIAPLNSSIEVIGYVNDIVSGNDVENTEITYKPNVKLILYAEYATKVSLSTEPSMDCESAIYMPITFTNNSAIIDKFGIGAGSEDKTVFACFSDDAGNVSKKVLDSIFVDNDAPKNVFFVINDGAEYTTSRNVTLNGISASDNYKGDMYMMISNSGDFKDGTGWINLERNYTWTLSDGDGNKQVFLKVRDFAGNESAVVMDNIQLDTLAPEAKGIAINNGDNYVNSLSVNVSMNVTGDVYEMRIACDGVLDNEPWLVFSNIYTCLLPPNDGNKIVKAIFRDKAGNTSNVVQDDIFLDTKTPTAPRIANSSQIVDADNYVVTLSVTSSDASPSSGFRYQCRDYSSDWYDCTFNNQNQRIYTLAQNKVNRLGVRAIDNAGNISGEDFVEIIEDSESPEPPSDIRVIEGNAKAIIKWDRSLSSDVKGYKLYYGPEPGIYNGAFATEGPSPIDVGNRLEFGLSSLVNGSTFYVTVTAYDYTEINGPHESTMPNAEYVLPNPITPEPVSNYDTDGFAYSVYVDRNYLYVADGNKGLKILDIFNPVSPVLVGQIIPSGEVRGVYVVGDYAYLACMSAGLVIVDISERSAPKILGNYDTSGNAYKVFVVNNLAYIADGTSGLQIVDVSNPMAPSYKGNFNIAGNNTLDVYVEGNKAYLAMGTYGIVLVDVSNPSAPSKISFQPTSSSAFSVFVSGTNVYAGTYLGDLEVIDYYSVSAPVLKGSVNLGGTINGLFVSANYVYAATGYAGLKIVDISDMQNPVVVGSYNTAGYSNAVTLMGIYGIIAVHNYGIQIVELSSTSSPSLVSQSALADTFASNIKGNYLIATDQKRLRLINVSNIKQPLLLGGIEFTSNILDIKTRWNFVYAVTGDTLKIVNIEDLSNITLKGQITISGSNLQGVSVYGKYAFLADYNGSLRIVDVSTPSTPSLVASLPIVGNPTKVAVKGRFAYIADLSTRLAIVDVSNPASPSLIETYSLGNPVRDVFAYGTYVFLAVEGEGLKIINVENPFKPVLTGSYNISGANYGVYIAGQYAFVANRDNGIYIFDISQISSPALVARYSLYGYAEKLWVEGPYVFISKREGGVGIVNLEP